MEVLLGMRGTERVRASTFRLATAVLALAASCALLLCVSAAVAGEREEPQWLAEFRFEESFNDNVKTRALGSSQSTTFSTISGRLTREFESRGLVPDELIAGVKGRAYSDFKNRNSVEFKGEARYKFKPAADLILGYKHVPRKLRIEDALGLTPDVFFAEHNIRGGVQRKFGKAKKWRIRVLVEGAWDEYDEQNSDRDAFTPSAALDLRYRWVGGLVPRLKLQYGERDTPRANFERNEVAISGRLNAYLPAGVLMSLRYRRSERDYTVATAFGPAGINSNFGRKDEIDQYDVSFRVPVSFVDGLILSARYKYRHSDSTRVRRNYDVHEVGLGIMYAVR